jgi:hypothetical protein
MTGRRSALALPLVLAGLLCLLCLLSCSRGRPPAEPAVPAPPIERPDPRARWYQLGADGPRKIAGPGAVAPTANLPWTVQLRVADMSFLADSLYFAQNGLGLVRIGFDAEGSPAFASFPDSLIFAQRTITTLVPRAGALTVHLYYNALLNTVPAERLALRGISLVSFLPESDQYAFLIPPFQRKNPEWEAVGFAPVSAGEYVFEWKRTDPAETRFAYTKYFPDSKRESSSTRDEYIGALGGRREARGGTSARARLFDACLAEIARASPGSSTHFTVRSRGAALRRTFRFEGEGTSIVTVPVFEDRDGASALLPDARVLTVAADGTARTLPLPSPPRGARYTDMVRAGGFLVLPWEEKLFTEVGAAGILFYSIEG